MGWYRRHAQEKVLHLGYELRDVQLWRAVLSELLGTFILLFVGLMNIVGSENKAEKGLHIDNLITPGLTFAAIIMTLIHIVGPTSHCHLNPAVTISLMICKRCDIAKGLLYIPSQIMGAVAGAALTYWIAPDQWVEDTHLGMTRLHPKLNMGQGLVVEIVGTMILVLLVLVISDPDPRKDFEGFPALSAGMMILACVFFMAPYTGCSLNPARSFGPAFVMMKFDDYHWIYWAGPIVGGVLAVLLYYALLVQGIHKIDSEPNTTTTSNPPSSSSSSVHPLENVETK